MTDPHDPSAVEPIRRFRARDLSPVELMDVVIARAEAVEPHVNACGDRYFDEARYRGRGPRPRPLEGIPTATPSHLWGSTSQPVEPRLDERSDNGCQG